ncbi:MAG: hypothetical protein V2I97_00990 [Desulfococcaceae bacterium]|nr:hypothetical protein [Desulfococcaceae bacterium]
MQKNAADSLFSEIFCQKVKEMGEGEGLSSEEQERIIKVFRQAMANSYMDEHQIYRKLSSGGGQ